MSINDRLTPFFSVGSEHAHDKKSPDPGERQVVKAPNRNYIPYQGLNFQKFRLTKIFKVPVY